MQAQFGDTIYADNFVSLKAKGLYGVIQALPQPTTLTILINTLKQDKRTSITGALKELVEKDYLEAIISTTSTGRAKIVGYKIPSRLYVENQHSMLEINIENEKDKSENQLSHLSDSPTFGKRNVENQHTMLKNNIEDTFSNVENQHREVESSNQNPKTNVENQHSMLEINIENASGNVENQHTMLKNNITTDDLQRAAKAKKANRDKRLAEIKPLLLGSNTESNNNNNNNNLINYNNYNNINNKLIKLQEGNIDDDESQPPTLEEFIEFCESNELTYIEPSKVYSYQDYYGWCFSNGNPITDWKAFAKAINRNNKAKAEEKEKQKAIRSQKAREFNIKQLRILGLSDKEIERYYPSA